MSARFHPQIPRPRVPIRRLEDGRHRAECQHCPWVLESSTTVRAEIVEYADAHRWAHRAGRIEVTR
jgi:hypothetical protein